MKHGYVVLLGMVQFLNGGMTQMPQQRCPPTTLSGSLTRYDDCLKQVMSGLFMGLPSTESMGSYLTRMCDTSAIQEVDHCQSVLERMLSVCVDGNQRKLLDILKKANKNGVYFLCQDSGNRLKEFRESDGQSCLTSTLPQQNACMSQHPLMSMYISDYEGNFCRYQQPQGLLCLKEALTSSQCTENSANFLIGYYEAIVASTPCRGGAIVAQVVLVVALSVSLGCFNGLY